MRKIENNKKYISGNKLLIKEWNFRRNVGINPVITLEDSNIKVWWECFRGHEWEDTIKNRVKGAKCPGCNGKKVIEGLNDLKTMRPKLALEWNQEKNGKLLPEKVTCGSNLKVWWKCKEGHEWEAVIASRSSGVGCPYCASRKIDKGFNDLASKCPEVAKEWNYEKNKELKPSMVTASSNKKVWWKCAKGHEWETVICARTRGNGCPYCSGKRAVSGNK